MAIPRTAQMLGAAGLVPFAASAVAAVFPNHLISEPQAQWLGVVSGGIILSFLGGIRWGVVLGPVDTGRQARDFALSTMPVLAALAALLLAPPVALALLIASFLLLALWDVLSVEAGHLPQWFGHLRMGLTVGAVVALLAQLVASLT